jgi:aminobenzoyl-glutamate utilization protein B
VALKNLRALNDLKITEADLPFAMKIRDSLQSPEPLEQMQQVIDESGTIGRGSTDVGDVSWVVPTTGFTTACWVPGTPAHSWQAVAAGGTEIAHRGMQLAARVMAATACDLLTQPELLREAQAEHRKRIGERPYAPLIRDGQKPPLDYRNPPRSNRASAGG